MRVRVIWNLSMVALGPLRLSSAKVCSIRFEERKISPDMASFSCIENLLCQVELLLTREAALVDALLGASIKPQRSH